MFDGLRDAALRGRLLAAFCQSPLLLVWLGFSAGAAELAEIRRLVGAGQWQQAGQAIDQQLSRTNLPFADRDALLFQRERIARMRLDFRKTREEVLAEARRIVPTATDEQFARWEADGAVERLMVDGQPWYFNRAAGNLFRIHPEARALKARHTGETNATPAQRLADAREVIANYDQTGRRSGPFKTFRVTYTLSVKSGVVPPGEIIRAWLPYPQTGGRQKNVRLISTQPAQYIHGGRGRSPSSIYFEQPAATSQPTRFQLVCEYAAAGDYQPIDPQKARPAPTNQPALRPFLAERPPHLVFTPALRELSRQIVGAETNPCLIARRLFQWVDENIPWAGAREYSTLDSLPEYALQHRHGDCGIQTMLFMALCRLNGIPARWESGWTTGADWNMHDWCQIYLAPYGWVPVDVSYGLMKSEDEREKWFYLGGIDRHRLVVNSDYSQPLYPAKVHFRSETVDFQRGEVEWRGGNLYFNQWEWQFEIQESKPDAAVENRSPNSRQEN